VTVAGFLVLVIGLAGVRLFVRVQRGKFGSRMLLKLAAIFALVGVIPGVLIYTVSYQFVSRSIESWFDVKVEGALDAGLNLGRGTLEAQRTDLANKTRLAAERLADRAAEGHSDIQPLQLERLREQLLSQDVAIVGATGQIILSAGSSPKSLLPDRPSTLLLRDARSTRVVTQIEGLEDDATVNNARIRALAFIPNTGFDLAQADRYLMVTQQIPSAMAANALAVQTAFREYQERALGREGLRKMYIGTLTLTLILAVFGALLLAMTLSNQIAHPLLLLAQGVREVAEGDLSTKAVFASRDELGGLTRSFADMTEQLAEARSMVDKSVTQLESARANLQTILDNLTAGVIVFDREGRIDTVNPGATRILRVPLSAYRGRRLDEVPGLEGFAAAIRQRYEQADESPEAGERGQWQESFELTSSGGSVTGQGQSDTQALLVRGAVMPHDARLMVFDDITEVVSAQRIAAWSEVARRLAHEIKNPLTPIQLSAERLQQKLEPKLEGADQSMLQRAVGTIVSQVQAMKNLVNEFRDYARLPAAQLKPLDLNGLVREVLQLYGQQQERGILHCELSPDLPPIMGDGSQLRQVIHNLVQNALDAVTDHADGRVAVRTEAVRTEAGGVRSVRLVVSDNGPGFAEKVLKRAFEPYVTTKSKGTGLGLAVVKKIADEHAARVRIANVPTGSQSEAGPGGEPAVGGAQVSLSFSKLAPPGSAAPPPPSAAASPSPAEARAH
jgi:nitrogen fixation/metabolism regulation signal transduction histidine kinase